MHSGNSVSRKRKLKPLTVHPGIHHLASSIRASRLPRTASEARVVSASPFAMCFREPVSHQDLEIVRTVRDGTASHLAIVDVVARPCAVMISRMRCCIPDRRCMDRSTGVADEEARTEERRHGAVYNVNRDIKKQPKVWTRLDIFPEWKVAPSPQPEEQMLAAMEMWAAIKPTERKE